MSGASAERLELVFTRRPKPVPGDLRITWRLSLTLLALRYSRGHRASLAKLHMLNDALRSEPSKQKLSDMIDGKTPYVYWRMRVEPAFSRNLDFLVGEGFANWMVSAGRTTVKLTAKGKEAAKTVDAANDALQSERSFLSTTGKKVTEGFVRSVIAAGNRLL